MEHQERADALDREADDLEQQSERLRDEVDDVREDWEAKKGDGSLPGAQASDDEQPDPAVEEERD